jgi:segregation and condensation protein B
MEALRRHYERRGVNLVRVGDGWAFRTAGDLAFLMSRDAVQQKKLSRAALEVRQDEAFAPLYLRARQKRTPAAEGAP